VITLVIIRGNIAGKVINAGCQIRIMLEAANRLFIALLVSAAAFGILLSLATLFLPGLLPYDAEGEFMDGLSARGDFSISLPGPSSVIPSDSPYLANLTMRVPELEENDVLALGIFDANGKEYLQDCPGPFDSGAEYAGDGEIECTALLPYDYEPSSAYRIYAMLVNSEGEYYAGPVMVGAVWAEYENEFMGFSWAMALIVAATYLFAMLPVALIVLFVASREKHAGAGEGEYSLLTLINPVSFGRGLLQKFHASISSPWFWALETFGIALILLYMAISAQMWKSGTAFIAFVFSGLMAFIVPFLWSSAWWYADYREREPLRIMITMFLWGMLAALMAIGINTLLGVVFALAGIGFLGSFLVAPLAEESFKGAGPCLFSEHHEFDSVEDGILYGFTVGMGFSFIENWIYFIDNPMGSDIPGWLFLFMMRSVFFSANHGFYTAITGAAIGFLIERGFRAPALGFLIGMPVAALFHAMHNSGEMLGALFGAGGLLIYCCFLIPLFDYGGFIILALLFAYSVLRKRGPAPPEARK
jgi:RsiW-degrading membrane proteinase PrsW (M82 family)